MGADAGPLPANAIKARGKMIMRLPSTGVKMINMIMQMEVVTLPTVLTLLTVYAWAAPGADARDGQIIGALRRR